MILRGLIPAYGDGTLIMSVTSRCGQRCSFCLEGGAGRTRFRDVPLARIARILRDGARLRGFRKVIFMGSETALRPDFPALLRAAKRAGLLCGAATSGAPFADAAFAARCLDAGLDFIEISAHGATGKEHDSITGRPGSFEKLCRAIENLSPGLEGLSLSFNVVLAERNFRRAAQIARFIRRCCGKSGFSIKFKAVIVQGSAREDLSQAPDYIEVAPYLAEAARFCGRARIHSVFDSYPLCALRGFEHRSRELIDLCAGAAYGKWSPSTGAGPACEVHDPLRYARAHGCGDCSLFFVCPGVPTSYRMHFPERGVEISRRSPLAVLAKLTGRENAAETLRRLVDRFKSSPLQAALDLQERLLRLISPLGPGSDLGSGCTLAAVVGGSIIVRSGRERIEMRVSRRDEGNAYFRQTRSFNIGYSPAGLPAGVLGKVALIAGIISGNDLQT